MGSNETATAIPGGPRVIAYLTGTGCHRAQIIYFFRMQIGARTRSGIGLGSGSRRNRMRRCLVLSRELWIENFWGSWSSGPERKGGCTCPKLFPSQRAGVVFIHRPVLICIPDGSARACAVGNYPCLVSTLGDPWATSEPRIDRIPPTRPTTLVARRRPRIKFFFFSPPRRVSIDISGPRTAQTIFKQLQGASHAFTPGSRGVRGRTSETPARRRRDPQDN